METRVVTAAFVVVAAALAAVSTVSLTAAEAAGGVAALVLLLTVVGREKLAVVALAGAFATAPMYRGLVNTDVATPTDILMLAALVLLLPEMFDREIRLPIAFLVAVGSLGALGLVASLNNPDPITSTVYVLQWLLVLGVIPIFIAIWQPSRAIIDGLLWCYLAGHLGSIVKALVEGEAPNGRYDGFAHHSNDFGLAGGVAVAIVLYLFANHRSVAMRLLLGGVMAASVASVVMSGSRGVTLATAVVILLFPLVERSGLWALLWTALGAITLALMPFILQIGGEGSSFARLTGDATATFSDNLREEAISDGVDRFLGSPFIGTGLDAAVGTYHNVFLEAAVAVGVFGLAAYLAVLYVLGRPILTTHPLRRLCYLTWLFVVVGATFPGLIDRTIAVPMALTILPAVRAVGAGSSEPADPDAAVRKEVPAC